MKNPVLLLENAKRHLLASQPDLALKTMQEFEETFSAGRVSREIIGSCSGPLEEIRVLADAAREGIASAKQHISEIIQLSRKLDTYDSNGKRVGNHVRPVQDQRF